MNAHRRISRRLPVALALALFLAWPAPSRATTLIFRQGRNGYLLARDTYLEQAAPGANNSGSEKVEWDGDDPAGTGQDNVALIAFDALFGGNPDQIPLTATINSATLTYTVHNAGDPGNVYEPLVNWTNAESWNSFGGTVGVQPNEYGHFVGSAAGSLGTHTIDVTASLQRWIADPQENRGWIILPTGSDGVQFRSGNYAADASLRPTLTVTFDAPPSPPALVRHPYLQLATPSSVKIVWRTDLPCDSRVRFGASPAALTSTVADSALVTDHVITLSGLSPATTYYYDAGTTTQVLAGGDAQHFAVTAPPSGTRTSFTTWIVGDSGNGSAAQLAVRDAMLTTTAAAPPDLVVHVGDIAYNSGLEQEFTDYYFTPYQSILQHTVCWPTLGNHEGANSDSGTQTGPYYTAYVLPTAGQAGGLASGTEAYYSFDHANVHFICLDSHDTPRNPGAAMLTWLAADLAATNQTWIVAFWHHPPYSKGTHDSDVPSADGGRMFDMRTNILPLLEAGGADLVLTGHSHIYERSYLVDGAYDTPTTAAGHILDNGDGRPAGDGAYLKSSGLNAHDGTLYVVAGHGGQPCARTGTHPLMYFTETANGSCLMAVDGNVMSLKNIRADGVISDHCQLVKTPPGDVDADGDVDAADLHLFVRVLLGLDLDAMHVARSDLNADARADGQDIPEFVRPLLAD